MEQQITSFGRGTSLDQALEELKENGSVEFTRIFPESRTFEYNVEDLKWEQEFVQNAKRSLKKLENMKNFVHHVIKIVMEQL